MKTFFMIGKTSNRFCSNHQLRYLKKLLKLNLNIVKFNQNPNKLQHLYHQKKQSINHKLKIARNIHKSS